ncbi:hypothetical protein HWV62_7152 [Athelia sp. TMB]|nr:hypothetical protein HWV62_22058 [Athelia sp. TMB]KAF7976267.1 hypothetical protein HWV62_7152 [Athelia sp. TMB]
MPLVQAALVPRHDHAERASIPGAAWHQPDDSPVHALFKRQSSIPTDGITYAEVGSAAWLKGFPNPDSKIDTTKLPKEWVDALDAAVAAGKIPKLAPSISTAAGTPTYPKGMNPSGPDICSGSEQCHIEGDIWDAPAGHLGCGFDDGPLPPSTALYDFLAANNQRATHFFIGTNIAYYPKQFLHAFQNGGDIAVHTWTHPYMTTQTNLQVLGELGYTMEIIHNSTGGRLPRYWRPPYGDTDVRVHAIAKEIFGLSAIIWNEDTDDWELPQKTSLKAINASMTKWLTGPKGPQGKIILEHELSTQSVQAFIDAYPVMISNGWNVTSAAQLAGYGAYQNANGSATPVTPATGVVVGDVITSEAHKHTTSSASASASASTSVSHPANSGGPSLRMSMPGALVTLAPLVVVFLL